MTGKPDQFRQLVEELTGLLAGAPGLDGEQSLRLAERREELERALITLLRPDTFAGKEARRSVRVPCQLGARLRTSTAREQVVVSNLSCGGALVELEQPIAVQAEVELEILAGPGTRGDIISRFGRVAWAKGRTAGIEFEAGTEPLDQRMLRFVLDLMRKD